MTPTMFGDHRKGDTIRRFSIRAMATGSDRGSTWDSASADGVGAVGVGAGARIGSAATYSSTTPSSIVMDTSTVSAADSGDRRGRTIPVIGWEWLILTGNSPAGSAQLHRLRE